MRLHLLEHDPIDLSDTNMTAWAAKKGYRLTHTYVCNNEALPSIGDFDWLMVMGGSPHAWEEDVNPWLPDEKELIAGTLDSGKMILGICFGAQLLAEALGGRVFPNDRKEIGWYDVTLTPEGRNSFLLRNVPERFTTFHWHSDHFSLPPGCTRLACSEPTANQAFICNGHPAVGLQFHPEYTREMVRRFAREESQEWEKDLFVAGKEAVLAQTDKIPDTYWLMETLLENMEQKFISPKQPFA
jgi:GMP synthase-like glutamine amidotransferase